LAFALAISNGYLLCPDASNGVMERGAMDFCVAVALGNTRSGSLQANRLVQGRQSATESDDRGSFKQALHLVKLSVIFITVSQNFPCRELILKTADSQRLGLSLPFIL
jgi:hypothetical protein